MKRKLLYVLFCVVIILSLILFMFLKSGTLNYTLSIDDESNDVVIKSIETYVNGKFVKTYYEEGNNLPNKFKETTIKGKHKTIITISIPSYNIVNFKVVFLHFNENRKVNYQKDLSLVFKVKESNVICEGQNIQTSKAYGVNTYKKEQVVESNTEMIIP